MLSARPIGLPLDRGLATKTPGRALSKTRNVLQENATRNVPMTVLGKGRKLVQNTPLPAKTLQTDRVSKDPGKQVGPSKVRDTPAIRPLGDKTPFPNRTANKLFGSGEKIAKPALADGVLRPSSVRKHDRLPRSASKVFETPVTDGKHWDVSDIDIEVDTSIANLSIEEEDLDEIEYMPPKVEDIPYEPPFEMPNYREVGQTLMALIRSHTLEDDPPSTDFTFTLDPSENNFFAPPTLPRPELKDESPFARAKPEPRVKPPAPTTARQRAATVPKPTPRPAAPRTTPATRTTTAANSRAPSTVRQPPPTSSARPPTTTRMAVSQPVTRAPTSQSTVRAAPSRATTRAPSVARSTSLGRAAVPPSRVTPVVRPTTRSTAPAPAKPKPKPTAPQPQPAVTTRPPAPAPSNAPRPRSGTITKAAFESNTHTVVHIRNNSIEDVKKDLEGLIVFEDAFDDDDGFRFDV